MTRVKEFGGIKAEGEAIEGERDIEGFRDIDGGRPIGIKGIGDI